MKRPRSWFPCLLCLHAAASAGGQWNLAPRPALSDREALADLRRARMRLERGDFFLAAPSFERLFVYFHAGAAGGPTVRAVAEGLARRRLAHGDAPGAVGPWLVSWRERSKGWLDEPFPSIAPLVDSATGLAPALAPIWLAGPELAALVEDEFRADLLDAPAPDEGAAIVRELALWYARSARFELGLDPDLSPVTTASPDTISDEGLRLVALIVTARIGDEQARADARAGLEAELASELDQGGGTWREAWVRAGLGRSLLRESEIEDRDRGLLELLHLPARFARSQPRLAALALAEASREYDRRRDASTARRLADLLTGPLADPVALRWLQSDPAPARPPGSPTERTPNSKDQPTP